MNLLIEANCFKTLYQLEVIPSQKDGTYALKAVLEWCIIGSMEVKKVDKYLSCIKRAVLQGGRGSTAKHNF